MSKAYLKIKVTSLAAEAKLIRKDELRYKQQARNAQQYNPDGKGAEYAQEHKAIFWGLRQHRQGLSPESRAANIAYGFLKGRRYLEVENKVKPGNEPNWNRVQVLVKKYGTTKDLEQFDLWKKEGEVISMLGKPQRTVRPLNPRVAQVMYDRKNKLPEKKLTFLEKIKKKLGLQAA
jgi:hypothetical protein